MEAPISRNHTTWLNIAFILVAFALIIRFVRTGGVGMLRTMGGGPEMTHHEHA